MTSLECILPKPCVPVNMRMREVVPVLLTIAACVSRLYRLHHPETPVYDETHVGRFLGWYHDRAFFFDVHGPLAKLSIYWIAVKLGFEGRESCAYESVVPHTATCDLLPQRLVPALCGAALIPVTYGTCIRMQLRPSAALLAAWFVLTDTHFLGMSRIHLNDAVQLFLISLTHYFALDACATPSLPPKSPCRRLLQQLAVTGTCLGCALQSKYAMALTTLGWLGLQNLWLLCAHVAQHGGLRAAGLHAAARSLLLLGIPGLLHVLLLRLHLAHLPRSGNGDSYMSVEFQASLAGSRYARLVLAEMRPSFSDRLIEHATSQLWYNRNMAVLFPRGSHVFDTVWYAQPITALHHRVAVTEWLSQSCHKNRCRAPKCLPPSLHISAVAARAVS